MRLTPVAVTAGRARNLAVPSANFARPPSGPGAHHGDRRRRNRGDYAATNVPVTLEVEGHGVETARVIAAQRLGVDDLRAGDSGARRTPAASCGLVTMRSLGITRSTLSCRRRSRLR